MLIPITKLVDFSPDVLTWKQLLLPKFGGWTKDYLCAFSEFFNSLYTCHHQLSAYFSRKYLLDLVDDYLACKNVYFSIHVYVIILHVNIIQCGRYYMWQQVVAGIFTGALPGTSLSLAHDVNASGRAHVCPGRSSRFSHKLNMLNRIILRELLPSTGIDEYNELSFCAVVTFSSHTSWILGAKTRRKSVHCKVRFTRVQFFCLRSTYVVVSVLRFLYVEKNVHVRHGLLNEHKLQIIVFDSILNSSDVFASVTLQQMDVCASFNPMDATASAGSRENGGRLRVRHGVNNIGHVCWSDVKLTTKFKFKIRYRRRDVRTCSRYGPDW